MDSSRGRHSERIGSDDGAAESNRGECSIQKAEKDHAVLAMCTASLWLQSALARAEIACHSGSQFQKTRDAHDHDKIDRCDGIYSEIVAMADAAIACRQGSSGHERAAIDQAVYDKLCE